MRHAKDGSSAPIALRSRGEQQETPPLPDIRGSKGGTGISTLDSTIYTLAPRKL